MAKSAIGGYVLLPPHSPTLRHARQEITGESEEGNRRLCGATFHRSFDASRDDRKESATGSQ